MAEKNANNTAQAEITSSVPQSISALASQTTPLCTAMQQTRHAAPHHAQNHYNYCQTIAHALRHGVLCTMNIATILAFLSFLNNVAHARKKLPLIRTTQL
jgi:hypothetical protein